MLSTMLSKLFSGMFEYIVAIFHFRVSENPKNGEMIQFINVPDSKVTEILSQTDISTISSEECINWLLPQLPDSSIVKQIAAELAEKKVVRFEITFDNDNTTVKYRCHHLSIDKFNNSVSMLINEDKALSYEDFMKLRNQNKSVATFKKVTDNSPSIKV